MSYTSQLQGLVAEYRSAGQPWPATTRQIAAWAITERRWAPDQESLIAHCADQISRAMREEYITDAQGRRVRAKHAARVRDGERQMVLWADIRSADPGHMAIAFQQRRQQIVDDCRQLKADVESYNENRRPAEPIQLVFDFTLDLEEDALAA